MQKERYKIRQTNQNIDKHFQSQQQEVDGQADYSLSTLTVPPRCNEPQGKLEMMDRSTGPDWNGKTWEKSTYKALRLKIPSTKTLNKPLLRDNFTISITNITQGY